MSTDRYSPDWRQFAKHVYERDKYRCQTCGERGGPYGNVELRVRHIVPTSRGGTDHPRNLQTLCRTCHSRVNEHHTLGSEDRVMRRILGSGNQITRNTQKPAEPSSETGGDINRIILVGGALLLLLMPFLLIAL